MRKEPSAAELRAASGCHEEHEGAAPGSRWRSTCNAASKGRRNEAARLTQSGVG